MSYRLLTEFSGSTLLPSRHWLQREDFSSLAEKAYLLMMALRILRAIPSTADWAQEQLRRTVQSGQFHNWKSSSTDLYVLLWALTQGEYPKSRAVPNHIPEQQFVRWLRALAKDGDETSETKRLFLRLDSLFHISDSSMRSVRRLVQDWPHISDTDKKLAVTRLLQMMRARMPRCGAIQPLTKAAAAHELELKGVCNLETGDGCEAENKAHIRETASAGATSAASVATVVGGLGAGFDPNGDYGIYGKPKAPKKKRKSTAIIRR